MKLYDHYHKFHPPFMSRCTELILLRYSDLLEVRSGTLIQLLLFFPATILSKTPFRENIYF
jgi:hypothetical protein